MDEIIKNLYVGDFLSASLLSIAEIEELKSWAFVSVIQKKDIFFISRALKRNKIKHLKIDVYDDSTVGIHQYFDEAADFIEKELVKGKNVLIHCAAGISRSVTIASAYLIKYQNLSSEEALEKIKSERSIASPNFGFRKQLEVYYLSCLKSKRENCLKSKRENCLKSKRENCFLICGMIY